MSSCWASAPVVHANSSIGTSPLTLAGYRNIISRAPHNTHARSTARPRPRPRKRPLRKPLIVMDERRPRRPRLLNARTECARLPVTYFIDLMIEIDEDSFVYL